MRDHPGNSRRTFLKLAAAGAVLPWLPPAAAQPTMARRAIPGTDEALPVIGLGTSDEFERMPADGGDELAMVLRTLVEFGGSLVDTAPGYGNAETQLDNLERFRDQGHVRYIGITTSRASGFEEMESLIRRREMDFIQVNYSPLEPEAAERVIPAAAERGVAVMINRAFLNGRYFSLVRGQELPAWAADFDCDSWAQLSLKWILGNPDVTCALAATSNPRHMADNAQGGVGRFPDAAERRRIEELLAGL